jgi:hypothetical protein
MKKLLVLVLLGALIIPAFADNAEKGALTIEVGADAAFITGMYGTDGEWSEIPSDISYTSIFVPVSVFFEIFPGFEAGIKARLDYYSEDWLDAFGVNRPAAGVKYTSDFGLGGFIDAYLPFGSEDIVGPEPEFSADFAVFYDGAFDSFLLYAEILYALTFEGDDLAKQDRLLVKVRPGFKIMDQLAITLNVMFNMDFNVIYDGEPIDDTSGYIFILAPGVMFKPLDALTLSLEAPISLFGETQAPIHLNYSFWGVTFKATFNLL